MLSIAIAKNKEDGRKPMAVTNMFMVLMVMMIS